MRKISIWVKNNWTDPVWSKVYAGIILTILGGVVTFTIALAKQIPISSIYLKSVNTYIKFSYFSLFVFVVIVLSFVIPLFAFNILNFKLIHLRRQPPINKDFLKDKNTLESLFPGKWINNYEFNDGRKGQEFLEIKNKNEYHALGKQIFNIDQFSIDKEKSVLIFRKNGVGPDKRAALNLLSIVNENFYEGYETNGTKISYTRVS